MEKTSSQDQCASPGSVHDESYVKPGQVMKPTFFLWNPDFTINAPQAEISPPMVQIPHTYSDPYLGGVFAGYAPHAMVQPYVMGAASSRVPLPGDLPEESPIYVNSKQYHAILRRRQMRAKLEAQNKLVKNRRPYLHESRHMHALNRVRGSGGRFLSAKNSESRSPTTTHGTPNSFQTNQKRDTLSVDAHYTPDAPSSAEVPSSVPIFQQQNDMFSSLPSQISVSMQGSGDGVYNGNRYYASVVR